MLGKSSPLGANWLDAHVACGASGSLTRGKCSAIGTRRSGRACLPSPLGMSKPLGILVKNCSCRLRCKLDTHLSGAAMQPCGTPVC